MTAHNRPDRAISPAPADPRWWERAACAGADPTSFELIGGTALTKGNRAALRLCRVCPVQAECLGEAVRSAATGVIMAGRPWFGTGVMQVARCKICGGQYYRRQHRPRLTCSQKCQDEARSRALAGVPRG